MRYAVCDKCGIQRSIRGVIPGTAVRTMEGKGWEVLPFRYKNTQLGICPLCRMSEIMTDWDMIREELYRGWRVARRSWNGKKWLELSVQWDERVGPGLEMRMVNESGVSYDYDIPLNDWYADDWEVLEDEQPRMDFGDVIKGLKTNKAARYARKGWNGKGMWIGLQSRDEMSRMTLPYIYMSTVQGDLVPWLASQTDMLADDWYEVRRDGERGGLRRIRAAVPSVR